MGRSIVDSALVWHSTKPAHDVLPVSSRRLDRRLFLSTHERASEKSCDDFSSNHSLWHGCMIPKSMATLNRFQIVKIDALAKSRQSRQHSEEPRAHARGFFQRKSLLGHSSPLPFGWARSSERGILAFSRKKLQMQGARMPACDRQVEERGVHRSTPQ